MTCNRLPWLVALAFASACGDNLDPPLPPAPELEIAPLAITTAEDTPVSQPLVLSGLDGTEQYAVSTPAHGTITRTAQLLTYTPAADYHGPDQVVVSVTQGDVTKTATVAITVTPVNDAPVGVADMVAGARNTVSVLPQAGLLANDTDVDEDDLSVTAVGDATNGTVALSGTDVRFTPTTGFVGDATFTYTLSDGEATATATVTIAVTSTNEAPVAVDDAFTRAEDTTVTWTSLELTTNDTDADGNTLMITAVGGATNGTVALAGSDITFTPTPNFNGAATFEYTVSDGVDTDVGLVTLTYTAVDDAPIVEDDTAATMEDMALAIPAATLLANDTEVDGQTLSVVGVQGAGVHTVALAGGVVTFTPRADFNGTTTFTYVVSDGALQASGTVTVNVSPVADAPVAGDDTASTIEDTAVEIPLAALLANDTDPDGPVPTVSSVQGASNGTAVLGASSVVFTPTTGFVGEAGFTYTITDGALTDTAAVTVTVVARACGDGDIDPGEGCDDGDEASGDGCSATCQEEPGWTCTGTPSACTTTCGDGVRAGAEACDDGDQDSGDGCSATCAVEPGYACSGAPSVCATVCGDGVIAGAEACDDSDATSNDGCSATCAVEPGWACTGEPSACTTTCGDGIVAGAEACDDGDQDSGDGCSSSCALEAGWTCTGAPSACATTCGDGVIAGAETCDDLDATSGDGCSAACQEEAGWVCTGLPSACATVCGDGIVAGLEACDDDNAIETDGCTTACVEGALCDAVALVGGLGFAVDPATGRCYASFAGVTTFADAQTACRGVLGNLATITSASENAFVLAARVLAQNPWIGASEDANDTDAVFSWITGEAWGYTNFAPGQPDDDPTTGNNGECLHIVDAEGRWNDTNCDFAGFVQGRICEIAAPRCGDGFLNADRGEECDDGNLTNADGCSSTCEITLVSFSFNGAAGTEPTLSADGTTPPASLTALPVMARGAGITANTAANAFGATGFVAAAAIDLADYFTFTVTPAAGVTLDLRALELDERRSGTGIRTWAVRSSLDGFAADLAVFAVPDDTNTRANQRIDLPVAFRAVAAPVEFRIYGYGAEALAGTWRIDNVDVFGVPVTP